MGGQGGVALEQSVHRQPGGPGDAVQGVVGADLIGLRRPQDHQGLAGDQGLVDGQAVVAAQAGHRDPVSPGDGRQGIPGLYHIDHRVSSLLSPFSASLCSGGGRNAGPGKRNAGPNGPAPEHSPFGGVHRMGR